MRARDADDLLETLDQVANPHGCAWAVYEGPLCSDVRLPAQWRIADERPGEPVTPEQVASGIVGRMRAAAAMGAEPPEGLMLGKTEAIWLHACWLATSASRGRATPGRGGGTGQRAGGEHVLRVGRAWRR